MQQNYQDAMAIVAKYGRPDLFLTYTCNPKICEIVGNLRPGERPENRPDLVTRVYKLHLKELLKDIKDRVLRDMELNNLLYRQVPDSNITLHTCTQCHMNVLHSTS